MKSTQFTRKIELELEFHEDREEMPEGGVQTVTTLFLPTREKLVVNCGLSADTMRFAPKSDEQIRDEAVTAIGKLLEAGSKGWV